MKRLPERRTAALIAAIAAVTIAIAVIVIIGVSSAAGETNEPRTGVSSSAGQTEEKKNKIIDVEREILVKTLEDGVRDMGLLITQEYYFTDAVTQSKIKTLFNIPLGFTETNYVATYDGVVTAGIDFGGVGVSLGEDGRTLTVRMPKAAILSVDIDPNSFILYSEKNGFGNPMSASDFNGSIVDLENKAREQAQSRGILEQADANAKSIVGNFINGFVDLSKYNIVWTAA